MTVTSAEAALSRSDLKSFNMIMMDEHLGDGMKGHEAIAAMRKSGFKNVIVGCSGDVMDVIHSPFVSILLRLRKPHYQWGSE